ncbi:MAG: conditioned medium-induced protein 4 [Halobacteriales archaeon]
MDEKTEELRDLFVDVTDAEAVTERQEEPRGSIATDEGEIEERLRSTIDAMAERYDLETSLSRSALVTIVRSFYAGESDVEIARDLDEAPLAEADGSPEEVVARARIALHLVTENDREGPVDQDALRRYLDESDRERSVGEIAAEFGVSEAEARRARRIAGVESERRLVGDRFRQEFEHALADRALSDRLTEGIAEDGLDEATEGIETDVSF